MGLLGTMNANRLVATPIYDPKTFSKKYERGQSVTYYTADCALTGWMDNRGVSILSNMDNGTTLGTCERRVKDPITQRSERKRIPVPQVVKTYNRYMGGVDLVNSQVALYRSHVHKNKWWFSLFTTGVSIMCVNAWRLWNCIYPKVSYLDFLREVCVSILTLHKEPRMHPGPLPSLNGGMRFDRQDHLIFKSGVKGVCQQCKILGCGKKTNNEKRTNYRCQKCDKALHPDNCFLAYHTLDI